MTADVVMYIAPEVLCPEKPPFMQALGVVVYRVVVDWSFIREGEGRVYYR